MEPWDCSSLTVECQNAACPAVSCVLRVVHAAGYGAPPAGDRAGGPVRRQSASPSLAKMLARVNSTVRGGVQMVGNGLVVVAVALSSTSRSRWLQTGQRSAGAAASPGPGCCCALAAARLVPRWQVVNQQVVAVATAMPTSPCPVRNSTGHGQPNCVSFRRCSDERLHADVHQHDGVAPVVLAHGGGFEEGRAAVPGGRAKPRESNNQARPSRTSGRRQRCGWQRGSWSLLWWRGGEAPSSGSQQ